MTQKKQQKEKGGGKKERKEKGKERKGKERNRSLLTCVCHIPHGVLEGPDNGIQHKFKLLRRNLE